MLLFLMATTNNQYDNQDQTGLYSSGFINSALLLLV